MCGLTMNNNTNESSSSRIAEFYKNKSVFVTGGTGFLGKAIVEKLLRSCPEIGNIYVLIRPKSGSNISSRLNQLLDGTLYDTVRSVNPKALAKVIGVAGDISEPCFGLSEEDQTLLTQEVSIVIHSAATVKFDENLKTAMNLNYHATEKLIDLSKRMKNLVAFVHVSTAYANCELDEIGEMIYPPRMDPKKLVKLIESMSENEIDALTPELLGKKPNTYSLTKALIETILSEASSTLPITIVRPSMVTATMREPIVGWVDDTNGPNGMYAAVGKGILRTFLCNPEKKADFIPLDIVVNLIISAAWSLGIQEHKLSENDIVVYNCCSGAENPLFWKEFERSGKKNWTLYPPSNLPWTPGCIFQSNNISYIVNSFFLHYIPFALMDIKAKLTGSKFRMIRFYQKWNKLKEVFRYYSTRDFNFKTDNMVALYNKLSPEDKMLFNFNVKEIEWDDYLVSYGLGIRTHILKEDISTLPAARKHLKRRQLVYKIIQLVIFFIFFVMILLGTIF